MRTQVVEIPYYPPMETHAIFNVIESAFSKVDLNCHKDVVLIVDDYTRPGTIQRMVFEYVSKIVGYERVVVLIASGMHRANSHQESIGLLGPNINKARLYSHNPMATPSPFRPSDFLNLNHKIVVGINTMLPHLHTNFSNCGKLICPGLESYYSIEAFHKSDSSLASLVTISRKNWLTIGFEVYVNSHGDVVAVYEQNCIDRPRKEYYSTRIPYPADIAILRPAIKNIDFQQTMNVMQIMKYTPLVVQNGTVCIQGDTPEGIGTHYLYQQPNGLKPVKYDDSYSTYLRNKKLAFIMPNVSERAIQDYFNVPITKYDNMEDFLADTEFLYGKDCIMHIYEGADIMIGEFDESI